jgi:TonB family protein
MKSRAPIPVAALALVLASPSAGLRVHAQSPDAKRAVKHMVTPQFPELAKKLNLSGTVRIEVTIGPDGIVKRSRILGGHPLLAAEAEHAAEKCTFEPGPKETSEVIEFKF